MVQKIIRIAVLFVTLLLLHSCDNKTDAIYYYQFQDRTDCDFCFPAYCFYYDTAFHYTAIQFGFYENDNGFLRDSVFFDYMRDSIKAVQIKPAYKDVYFDSIECYFEYPSHWRFTFEMSINQSGKCRLYLYSPYYKEGMYLFDITPSEKLLVNHAAHQLQIKDTGVFMTFDKRPHIPGDPIYFAIKMYTGNDSAYYYGDQDADDVPDEIFFFRDAIGAIAQNHFSKQCPKPSSEMHISVSYELDSIIDEKILSSFITN